MADEQLLAFVGAHLPDYQMVRVVGQGGMGIVLLCQQKSLDRKVAVKLLHGESMGGGVLARFRREAQMYAQLSHPNLVRIYDAQIAADLPYIVLEFIDGVDLKTAVRTRLAGLTFGAIARGLAEALAYVHARGILHRDIKPANVMLRSGTDPVLMDFGLAKTDAADATALTGAGGAVGTPLYMPPEVLTGDGAPTAASDVYSLGLVLYETALGRIICTHEPGGLSLAQRVRQGIPRLAAMGVPVSPEVDEIIASCVSLKPDARPSAAALAEGLAALDLPAPTSRPRLSGANRVSRPSRVPVSRPGGSRGAIVAPEPTAPPARASRGRLALALALAIAAIGVGWTIRSRRPAVPDPAETGRPSVVRPPPASPAVLPSMRIGKDGALMVLVPAGWFSMGAVNTLPDEAPVHRVWLGAFYIDRLEVSNALYARFSRETGHKPPIGYTATSRAFDLPDHPVVGVTWHDAMAYARWAMKDLPTEAEWEKAARGTDQRQFPWGNDSPATTLRANYGDRTLAKAEVGDGFGELVGKLEGTDGYHHTAPVGSFPRGASPYGALNMAGNVWEWCKDWYDEKYYSASPAREPTGPTTGTCRVARGGSWDNAPRSIRPCRRGCADPTQAASRFGFRCVVRAAP